MRTIALAILAAGFCLPARADWVLIFRYSDADVHADPASIVRSGDRSAMWSVSDSRKDGDFMGTRYRSVRSLIEYDCVRRTSLHVKSIYHRGQMGLGEVSGTVPPPGGYFLGFTALPLLSDTPEAAAWHIACRGR